LDRFVNGKLEAPNSGPRTMALNAIKTDKYFEKKLDKYDLKLYNSKRINSIKVVDMTQSYNETLIMIQDQLKNTEPFSGLTNHRLELLIVRKQHDRLLR